MLEAHRENDRELLEKIDNKVSELLERPLPKATGKSGLYTSVGVSAVVSGVIQGIANIFKGS